MAVFVAAVLCHGEAAAQFSMHAVGEGARLSVPMPFRIPVVEVDVVNEAKARWIRRQVWRQRNKVDFKISAQGMTTQFNESWTTNNQNSIVVELSGYYDHTYTKNRFSFWFKFDGKYGMNHIDDIWFKHQDWFRIDNQAKWAIRKTGFLRNWAYSASADFISQFAVGYKGRAGADRNVVWSNFLAPGTLKLGAGIAYTSPDPKLPFVITFDPFSGSALFVTDDRIDPDRRQKLGIPVTMVPDPTPDDPDHKRAEYKNYKIEGGSNFSVRFNRTFAFGEKKRVTLQYDGSLGTFYGWMTQAARHDPDRTMPEIMPTVNWTNTLTFKPLRFLVLEFRTTMQYNKAQIDKVQMQYYLRVGLEYRYQNR